MKGISYKKWRIDMLNKKAIFYKEMVNHRIKKIADDIEKIEKGTYQFDGSMPKQLIKPMLESHLKAYKKTDEWLSQFDDEHDMTSDEEYKFLKIVNNR